MRAIPCEVTGGVVAEYNDLQRKISESAARDFNADLLQQALRDFKSAFSTLTAPEQAEALQCVLKGVNVHRQKLELEVFELAEFQPGSQNRQDWLGDLDSNQDSLLQRQVCYRLHHPRSEPDEAAGRRPVTRRMRRVSRVRLAFCDCKVSLLLASSRACQNEEKATNLRG